MVRHPYPRAVRLCEAAALYFPLIEAKYYQVDLISLSPRKYVNLAYAWLVEMTPSDKIADTEEKLNEPLPWHTATSAASEQLESDSFFAMMAKTSGG